MHAKKKERTTKKQQAHAWKLPVKHSLVAPEVVQHLVVCRTERSAPAGAHGHAARGSQRCRCHAHRIAQFGQVGVDLGEGGGGVGGCPSKDGGEGRTVEKDGNGGDAGRG